MRFKPGFRRRFPIDAIKVGPRYRRDLGDLGALVESIKRDGVLHPVVIDPKGTLIAGARRLAAVKRLGWKRVPVIVMVVDDPTQTEADENFARADFLPSERVAIAEALMERAQAAARERQRAGLRRGATAPVRANVANGATGKAIDLLARRVGWKSGRTLERALAVVQAASENPTSYGPLVVEMDKAGKVDGVHRKLVAMQNGKAQDRPKLPTPVVSEAPPPAGFPVVDRILLGNSTFVAALIRVLDKAERALHLRRQAARGNRTAGIRIMLGPERGTVEVVGDRKRILRWTFTESRTDPPIDITISPDLAKALAPFKAPKYIRALVLSGAPSAIMVGREWVSVVMLGAGMMVASRLMESWGEKSDAAFDQAFSADAPTATVQAGRLLEMVRSAKLIDPDTRIGLEFRRGSIRVFSESKDGAFEGDPILATWSHEPITRYVNAGLVLDYLALLPDSAVLTVQVNPGPPDEPGPILLAGEGLPQYLVMPLKAR